MQYIGGQHDIGSGKEKSSGLECADPTNLKSWYIYWTTRAKGLRRFQRRNGRSMSNARVWVFVRDCEMTTISKLARGGLYPPVTKLRYWLGTCTLNIFLLIFCTFSAHGLNLSRTTAHVVIIVRCMKIMCRAAFWFFLAGRSLEKRNMVLILG